LKQREFLGDISQLQFLDCGLGIFSNC